MADINMPLTVALWSLCVSFSLPALEPGPGVTQPRFSADEVGTAIGRVGADISGGRITIAAMVNGYLYTAISNNGSEHAWWDISNPRRPVRVFRVGHRGDKPHSIGFWNRGRYGVIRTNGRVTSLYDFRDFDQRAGAPVLRSEGLDQARYSMWSAVQGRYLFRTVSGYVGEPGVMEYYDVSDPDVWDHRGTVDIAGMVGFKVASVHPLGDLLVCSAAEARGIATLDISDPLDPQVLDVNRAGATSKIYMSVLRGDRLFTASNSGDGVEAYDIGSDGSITLVGRVLLTDNSGDVKFAVNQKYVSYYEDQVWSCWNGQPIHQFDADSLSVERHISLGSGRGDATVSKPNAGGKHAEFILPLGNMIVEVWNGITIRAIAEEPDRRPPQVLRANPFDGQLRVGRHGRLGLSMSEPILPESVHSGTMFVRPVGGSALSASTSVQQHTLLNVVTDQALAADTVYELVLTAGGVSDLVGNSLDDELIIRFSTGADLGALPTRTVELRTDPVDASIRHVGGSSGRLEGSGVIFEGLSPSRSHTFGFDVPATDALLPQVDG